MMETTIAMLMAAVMSPAQCNPPPGVGDLVSVQPVVLQAASGLETSPTLPTSVAQVTVGTFVVELWARQVDPLVSPTGLIGVFSDLTFDGVLMTCNNVTAATQFNFFPSGSCAPGLADEVGGNTLDPDIGVADWARVATIDMSANFATPAVSMTAGPASTVIAIFGCGVVPVARIDFGAAMFDIIQPCTSPAQCDDFDDCNGIEDCDGTGQCVPGTPVVCSGSTPICDPSNGACVECFDSMQCEDFNACTGNVCNVNLHTCEFPVVESCSDGNVCTQDVCNPVTAACTNPPVDCSDPIICNVDSCDPSDGTCFHDTPSPVNLEWSPSIVQNLLYACSGVLSPGDLGQLCTNDDLGACSGNPTDCVSEQFDVQLIARPADGVPVTVFGLEAILTWETDSVTLLAAVPDFTYQWLDAGFSDGPASGNLNDGIHRCNSDGMTTCSQNPDDCVAQTGVPGDFCVGGWLPLSDGDALWSAQGNFDPPLGIGPAWIPVEGLPIATFTFTVSSTKLTAISVAASVGPVARTAVLWGGEFECPTDGSTCNPNDGQCAPGIECTRISEAAGCEIQGGLGSAVIPTSCGTINDCGDLDGDAITDDVCFWVDCEVTGCNVIERVFGDMGGPLGECLPDGFANLADALHALTCFAASSSCAPLNVDVGGPLGSCVPDGFCNLADALHALTTFAGTSGCSCPLDSGGIPGPSIAAPQVVDHADMFLAASRRAMRPGDQVSVRVFVDNPLSDLQSYQLDVEASGGRRGQLELVEISIDDRWDHVFSQEPDTFEAFNLSRGQMLQGMTNLKGVATSGQGYMATYTYRASDDAVGTFVVDVRPDVETFLVASNNRGIQVDSTRPAVVVVSPRNSRAAR